jgi:hypothetical protein
MVDGKYGVIFSDNKDEKTYDIVSIEQCDENGHYDAENITTAEVPYRQVVKTSTDRDEVICHYDWLEKHLNDIWIQLLDKSLDKAGTVGIIVAHGDKCYQYREQFKSAGIPFHHGVALYLLSYVSPYCKEVRETDHGFVKPVDWVINNYRRFQEYLPRY